MSPDAKELLRKRRHWDMVDQTDLAAVLVITHIAALILGYAWGHR